MNLESSNYVDLWLKDFSNNTQETYKTIISKFILVSGAKIINQISQQSIDAFLQSIQSEKVNSKHLKTEALKSFLAFLHREKVTRVNLSEMIERVKPDRATKAFLEFDEFFDLVHSIKKKSDEDFQILMLLYLERLKASEVASKIAKPRQSVNAMVRKYHPVATPEMIKNSLTEHSKKLAEFYILSNLKGEI